MDRLNILKNILSFEKYSIVMKYKPQRQKFYETYLHSKDTRKPQQVLATVNHIEKITDQNLERINQKIKEPVTYDKQKYKNCIFICLHGIPPFVDEFEFLNLPGPCFFVAANGFETEKNQEYIQKHLRQCRFSYNAQKINKIVKENPSKDIVFVSNSFGTFNLSVYFHKYGYERVKGIIDFGPAPIRFYRYASEVVYYLDSVSEKDLFENKNHNITNKFQEMIQRMNREQNLNWADFPSLTYTLAFLSYFKSEQIKILFDLNRKWPNILKLTAFGGQDNVLEYDLISERAEFYSNQKIQIQPKLKAEFYKYSQKVWPNFQQNFIYMIPKGKHSLHLQRRIQPILAKAVKQYLEVIFI